LCNMMRRTVPGQYFWSRYRVPTQAPRFDGPAPVAAPQNMNNTKTNEFIDPIDDKFPKSIRGGLTRPDVPEDQYVDSWYVCTSMTHHLGDYRPWSSSAPPNAYRFRPFNEFDAKGREIVQNLRSFVRYDPRDSIGRGQQGFPHRESYLTSMNPENHVTPTPSLDTIMSRSVVNLHQHRKTVSPLAEQRDVGRNEAVIPTAGSLETDRSRFPYNWKTEDWYEYEISKARMKRFVFENNSEGSSLRSSEVTYKIVLEGLWDHHVLRLADDVAMFIKEIGRQIVEERLIAVRKQLSELEGGTCSVDPEMLQAFNAAQKGPFGGSDLYTSDEVAAFLCAELRCLEQQCLDVINRCNVPVPGAMNLYDHNTSWPHVEKLEPWVRLAEYWTSASDTSFTELEMSTAHAEFRRYFRVVVVKMPFQSSEFEKRIFDIRHWLHRQTTCEVHTIYKRNHVHDGSKFPTEHNAANASTHEHHRIFSFALDWQSAPAGFVDTEQVINGDTWESIARRVGSTTNALISANADVEFPKVGETVVVPLSSSRRATSTHGGSHQVLPLVNDNGSRIINSWEEAATALGCTIEELQVANGAATANYLHTENRFHESTVQLEIPLTSLIPEASRGFAAVEDVMSSDTFESIALRLGCSVSDLKEANPSLADVRSASVVHVPQTARSPRRLFEPLLRPAAATASLIPRTVGEETSVPNIPNRPKNHERFPHEYNTTSSRFPVTPKHAEVEDWLTYTSKFLDKDLKVEVPSSQFTVNKLWPMQQVPGKIDQTPFEEDQTWLMHHIPVQQMEQHHPEKELQDLPFTNHEQFAKSIEWTAP